MADESEDVKCVWFAMQLGHMRYATFGFLHTHPTSLIDAKMYKIGFACFRVWMFVSKECVCVCL